MSWRPWWNLSPCGTDGGYERHKAHGQKADPACLAAHAAAEDWRQKRRRGEVLTTAEARAARLRRMHADCTALRKAGVAFADMPLAVQQGERAYQAQAQRRRRAERVAGAPILVRLLYDERQRGNGVAA